MPPTVLRCKAYLFFKEELSALVALCKRKFHGLKLLRTLRAYAACCPAVQSIIICRIIRLKIKFVLFKKRIMPLCRKTKKTVARLFFVVCVLLRIELLRYLPKASTKDAYSLSEICNIAPWRGAKSKL